MQDLGSLISNEILSTFKETFRDKDFSSSFVKANQYLSFNNKLNDCVNNTQRAIIWNCMSTCSTEIFIYFMKVQQHKGIVASLLVYDDGTDAIAEGQLDDKLSVIANFQALQTIADQTCMLLNIIKYRLLTHNLSGNSKGRYDFHVTGDAQEICVCTSGRGMCIFSDYM